MIPLFASIEIGQSLPTDYFCPPSLPERPVLRVIAFFGGVSYHISRAAHGAAWVLNAKEPKA